MASLDDINKEIIRLLTSGLAAPPGVDADRHDRAVAYALARYTDRSFESYARCLRWLGFAGRARGLDLGSGVGPWCLAFAHYGGHATGIEMRPEFVAVAEQCARSIGYAGRVRFLTERIETAELPSGGFDAVWSHSVLMYADAETAIEKAASWLGDNGHFYLGYTGEGARLDQIEAGLLEGEGPDRVTTQLSIALNGYLHRAGLYHTVGGRVRMLRLDDLRRICDAFGLSYRAEPGVQDYPGRYRGVPVTVDLLARKTAGADSGRNRLLRAGVAQSTWLSELDRLLRSDCPRLVCDVVAEADPELVEEAHRDLYARALIRAGRARGTDAQRVFEGGTSLPEMTKGLYAHDRGQFADALRCYRLDRDHPDARFLSGCCLLQLGDWDAARQEFRSAVESGRGQIREWVGIVAAHYRQGDHDGARAAYRSFLQTRE